MLQRLWRRGTGWESAHFYNVLELFIEYKDHKGLNVFLSPLNHYITHFYEPRILQALMDSDPEIPNQIVTRFQSMIEVYESSIYDCQINEWEQIYSLEGDK